MASSTRIPMASTIANMVNTLIEKPSASITANDPSMATGTTSAGISVYRTFCRNRYITRNTSTMASARVCSTCSIDTFT
ncbi:hypothetical protein D3C73_1112470 [compost metagenome]